MGGGGGSSIRSTDLAELEAQAKESIEAATESNRSNVFISFNTDDIDEVNLLRGQAKNEKSDLEFNDHSVKKPYDSDDANYIKQKIRQKIRRVSILLVYVTDNTYKSSWVNWEIHEAIKLGKGIMAMHKGDTPPIRLPDALTENDITPVKWNHKRISREIQRQRN